MSTQNDIILLDAFEYITMQVDTGDLTKLCDLGSVGFDIAAFKSTEYGFELILKRKIKNMRDNMCNIKTVTYKRKNISKRGWRKIL